MPKKMLRRFVNSRSSVRARPPAPHQKALHGSRGGLLFGSMEPFLEPKCSSLLFRLSIDLIEQPRGLTWMTDIDQTLRTKLGRAARKVPTRTLPDVVLRFLALFDPEIRAIAPGLGRKNRHTSEKAQRLLAWHPRPAAVTVVDCAESLMTRNAVVR
jgi:hypothetical protein